jgi:hypothetical protein
VRLRPLAAAITRMASRAPIHILRAVSGVRANLPSGAVALDKALSAVDDEGLRLRQLQHDERAKGVMDRLKGHKRRQKAATDTRGDIIRYIDEALRLNTLVRSATAAAAAATAVLADAPYYSELQSFQAAIDSDWFDELQLARLRPSRGLLEPEEAARLHACEQQLENEIAELCRDIKVMLAPPHAAAAVSVAGSVDDLSTLDSLHLQSQQLGLNEQGAVAVYQRAAAAIANLDSGFVARLAAAHALQLSAPTCADSSDVRARFSKVWREAFATNRPRAVYLRQLQMELQLPVADCISIDTWYASVRKSTAASEREIVAWKKSRAAIVTAAYDELLALAAAELAAAEHAADSECVRPLLQDFRHVHTGVCCRYWQRKRAAARSQLQLLRREHEARLREQEEKEDAERLLNQVSKGVRDKANAKQRAENKRALSARARELEAAQRQSDRCGLSLPPLSVLMSTAENRQCGTKRLPPLVRLPLPTIESVCSFEMQNSSKSARAQLQLRKKRRRSSGGEWLHCKLWLAASLRQSRLIRGVLCRFVRCDEGMEGWGTAESAAQLLCHFLF